MWFSGSRLSVGLPFPPKKIPLVTVEILKYRDHAVWFFPARL
jgi:hypothetical protein